MIVCVDILKNSGALVYGLFIKFVFHACPYLLKVYIKHPKTFPVKTGFCSLAQLYSVYKG